MLFVNDLYQNKNISISMSIVQITRDKQVLSIYRADPIQKI